MGKNETQNQTEHRGRLCELGYMVMRNNTGVAYSQTGRPVRFGLCNDSAAQNKNIKSSDLIGIIPVVVTPQMVGKTIGQFAAWEVKKPTWEFTGTPQEVAQLRFLQEVRKYGGKGEFLK